MMKRRRSGEASGGISLPASNPICPAGQLGFKRSDGKTNGYFSEGPLA